LTKKEIRTHYSGFILFAAKLITVTTGIVFTLIIARSVTQDEYGAWGTLNILIPYFTLLSSALPFWIMRFVARDKEGAPRTGIVANSVFAAIATLVYLALTPLVIPTLRLENYAVLYVAASAQIIEVYLMAVLEACLQAKQPHFIGYGLLVGEVVKVSLASVFVLWFHQSLLGVILSITVAFAVRILFYFRRLWSEIRGKIMLSYVREWVKGSVFNIYSIIGDRIAAIIFLMITLFGGSIATSYYQAALPIANIITYSSFIAFALYPKILAENKVEDATTSLGMVLMFALPMTAGVLALPGSYLVLLKESVYVPAEPVLIILAIDALILTISGIYSSVLYGIERPDEKASIPFRQVAKSRLFIVFSLPYIHSMITLPTAFYVLTNFARDAPVLVAMYVTAINTIAHVIMFAILYIIVRRTVRIGVQWTRIAKYVFASGVMAAFLFLAPHPTKISSTLAVTAAGGAIYFLLLMAIDRETRELPKAVLREIRSRK
jgi:O-antigen/teichoic acid export membrane protein